MARSKKSKKSKGLKVRVDFSGVETRQTVPEGEYAVSPMTAAIETGEESGSEYIEWKFEVVAGKYKGATLKPYNTSLLPQALWNLKGLLVAMGENIPDGAADLDLEDLLSRGVRVGALVEHDTFRGKKQCVISDLFPVSDVGDSEEDDEVAEAEEAPSAADVKKMNEDELEEVIDTHDLDVDLDGIKGVKKKRQAVIDALEEGEEEEEEDEVEEEEAEEEEDEVEYNEDEILKMKIKALQEIIDSAELEVDLDDFKSLKKQRAAVVEALEEEGLL